MKGDQERLLGGESPAGDGEVSVSNRESHKARGTLVRGGVCCLRGMGAQSAAWGISSKHLGARSLPPGNGAMVS